VEDDCLDLDKFRLSPEQVATMNRAYAKARAKATGRAKRSGAMSSKCTYVQMTRKDAVAGFHALGCPRALVWYHLLFLAWKLRSTTVPLANKALEAMGVSRKTKRLALTRLEADGLIKVKRKARCSPHVTILNWTQPLTSKASIGGPY
jgi:hypothetical protein